MKYTLLEKNEKIRVAFLFQVASFWPSWEDLYNKLKVDERFEIKLFYLNVEGLNKAQTATSHIFLTDNKIEYELYDEEKFFLFKPHYLIIQTPYDKGHRWPNTWSYYYKLHGIRVVYIPYGIEISDTKESRFKHFSMSVVTNARLIYVMSELMKVEYEKYCLNAKAVRACGLPRFDSLIDKEKYHLPENVRERIGDRKVVLWKVHFPKIFMINGMALQVTPDLDEYIGFTEYIKANMDLFFIFMPHPKFVDETIEPILRKKAERLLDILKDLSNVYIDWTDDYRNSLVNADAIMVDRSAIMVEAGAMKVPVLYLYNKMYYEPMTEPIQQILDTYDQGVSARDMEEFLNKFKCGKSKIPETVLSDGENTNRLIDNMFAEIQVDNTEVITERLCKTDRIIVFGTGHIWDFCKDNVKDIYKRVQIVAFADNSKEKQGGTIDGVPIISPEEINNLNYEYIMIATDIYRNEIYGQLINQIGVDKNKILFFDMFMVLLWEGNDCE